MPASSDILLERLLALHPKRIDLSLSRILRLLKQLDNPQDKLNNVIHVAGTNGKGSVCAMLYAGLQAAGKRIQLYTSPHLVRFHERIRLVDGTVSESKLIEALNICESANEGEPITFFEITTAAALWLFAQEKADYTIIETGLGGRLDATNIFNRPILTIICPISIDHTQFLGDTVGQIATEKAGILKKDVTCILAEQVPEALDSIVAQAREVKAPVRYEGEAWEVKGKSSSLEYSDNSGSINLPLPALSGNFQLRNAGLALYALRRLNMPNKSLVAAVRDVQWPARLQRLKSGNLFDLVKGRAQIWLDGGHNSSAGRELATYFASKAESTCLYLIVGMMDNKDIKGFLQPFASLAPKLIAAPIDGEVNSAPADKIAALSRNIGLCASTGSDVKSAIKHIAKNCPNNSQILITGSLYLVGKILSDDK